MSKFHLDVSVKFFNYRLVPFKMLNAIENKALKLVSVVC